jgi:uncharacterized OsmC-like protein
MANWNNILDVSVQRCSVHDTVQAAVISQISVPVEYDKRKAIEHLGYIS